MGNLPSERITPARPFSKVGLDYAGPISVCTTKGRGHRSTKGYLCVFVCLCTKAVHLEIAGDLTTPTFIAALLRFAGRRGAPAEIWSDNASTFHGADAELKAILREASIQWSQVADELTNQGISWKFIPPGAPNFGGLWEAAVKSAKSHLKRVIRHQTLTYEELSTFFVMVEKSMNCCPLTPLSNEPSDIKALTPGHFLVGSALSPIPIFWFKENEVVGFVKDTARQLNKWRLESRLARHEELGKSVFSVALME